MITSADLIAFQPKVVEEPLKEGFNKILDFYNGGTVKVIKKAGIVPNVPYEIPIVGSLPNFQTKDEGVEMMSASFNTNSKLVTPKIKALAVDFTLESGGAYFGSMDELEEHIVDSLQNSFTNTIEADTLGIITTVATTNDVDASAKIINVDDFSLAISKAKSKNKGDLKFFISYAQEHQVRTMKDANGNYLFVEKYDEKDGSIGTIFGVKIVVSDLVVAYAGTYDNYLVQDGSVGFLYGTDALKLDSDVNKKALTYSILAHACYKPFLMPTGKIVRVQFKEA